MDFMRINRRQELFATIFLMIILCVTSTYSVTITGELKQWHRVTFTLHGPETSEHDAQNPFLNYRLTITFTNGDIKYVIPGYFAADGNAAETSATSGNKWKIHFTPDRTGDWSYVVSFRTGRNIAIADDPDAGAATAFDGASGTISISKSDKSGRDFRSKGILNYIGERYLQHAGSKEYFLKAGADSPENFLDQSGQEYLLTALRRPDFPASWLRPVPEPQALQSRPCHRARMPLGYADRPSGS